jgi:hypothetical protein
MNLLKRFLTNQKAVTQLLFANEVFSHGWNDPSEITFKKSIILDVLYEDDDIDQKLHYWNKKYYDVIYAYYSLSRERLEQISGIVGVPADKYRELYAHWPKNINTETYKLLFDKLNLKFVSSQPVNVDLKGRYGIVFNESFWNIPTHNSNLTVDIINSHEATFDEFELIHLNEGRAMLYGIIIYDRLCNQRGPDNEHYYHERIQSQLRRSMNKIPPFNYNSGSSRPEDKKAEYDRILTERGSDLAAMRQILLQLKNRPFSILKL